MFPGLLRRVPMVWITLLSLITFTVSLSDSISNNDIQSRIHQVIHEAAHDVIKVHSNQHQELQFDPILKFLLETQETSGNASRIKRQVMPPSRVRPTRLPNGFLAVPEISVSEQDFAHDYISQTGVGNREEIKLVHIREENVRMTLPSPPVNWRFTRFNSSDFFMSVHGKQVNVWRMIRPLEQPFDQRLSLCSLVEEEVVLSDFHTRTIYHSQVLRISLVVFTPHSGFLLKTFEVSDSGCIPLTVFQLRNRPKKLIVVSSQYESAVVVLTEGVSREAIIEFKQVMRDSSSRVIEVSISNALHLTSFKISGHPYLAIGHGYGVEVGRLNEMMNHYMPFDIIPLKGVTDIQMFQMGFSLYMGVTTDGFDQRLFEWKSGSFRLKQSFPVARVASMKLIPVPSCRDDILLLFMRFDRRYPLLIYSWSASRQEFLLAADDVRRFGIPVDYNLVPETVVTFAFNRTGFLLSMDASGRPHVLSFHTVLIPVQDPVYLRTLEATDMMKNHRDRLIQQEDFIYRLSLLIRSAVRSQEVLVLNQAHVFQNLAAMRPSVFRKIQELGQVRLQGSPMTLRDLRIRTSDLKKIAHGLLQSLKELESLLKHIAFKNQPTIMSGRNVLTAGDAFLVNSTHNRINFVTDMNLSQLLSGIFQLRGSSRPILARKMFSDLTVIDNVNAMINGVDMRNIVTVHSPNLITSPVAVNNLWVRQSLVARDINGIDMTRDVICLDRGIYFIQQPVIFTSPVLLIFGLVTPRLASVDLNFLKHEVLLTNSFQVASSPIFFASRVSLSNEVKAGKVNGWNLLQLAADVVRVDQDCFVVAPKQFMTSELLIRTSLLVNGTLNGVRVPDGIFMANLPQEVAGSKRLVGHHSFEGAVVVDKLLDGLVLNEVIRLSTIDELPPLVFARGMDVFSSILGARSVDGVDLRLLNDFGMKGTEEGGRLYSPVFSGPVLIRGNLQILGPVNNMKLSALASDTVLVGSPFAVRGCKTFSRGFMATQGVMTTAVNNVNLNDLSRTDAAESISRVVFHQPVFRNVNVKDSLINGIDIRALHLQRICLSSPGLIAKGKRFVRELRTNFISVNGTIQDVIPLRDLTSKSARNQVVTGGKKIERGTFKGLVKILKGLRGHLLDGVNVTRLSYHRVTLDSQQVMRMPALLVDSDTDFLFSPVYNNLNLAQFLPNVLLINEMRQIITGNKTWVSPAMVMKEVESVRGVNGIHLQELHAQAVKLHGNTVVTAPFTFDGGLKVKDVVANGRVDGIPVNLFVSEVLFKNNNEVVMIRNNTFIRGFKVTADLDAARINHLHLPSSVFLRVGHQTISGNIELRGGSVTGKRDMTVRNSVNGISLSKFDQEVMKTNVPSTVKTDMFFEEPLHARGSIGVAGRVSGMKLNHLHKNTLYKIYDQFVPEEKVFTAPITVASDLHVMTLDNVSFADSLKDILFVHKANPVEILKHKTFGEIVIFHRNFVSHANQTVVNAKVKGLHLHELVSSIVMTDRMNGVSGIKTFRDPMTFASSFTASQRLNSIRIPEDVLLLIHPQGLQQIVTAPKTFDKIAVDFGLSVEGKVNGLDLKSEASDTLYATANQRISGRKNFTGQLILQESWTTISEPHFNAVAQLKGDNHFLRSISFTRPLQVEGSTSLYGRLNKRIHLDDLVKYSLTKDTPQVLTGLIAFDQVIFFGNTSTRGPINGITLNKFAHDVLGFKQRIVLQEKNLESSMTQQLKKSSYTFDLLLDSPFVIESFILRQELPGIHGNHYEIQGDGMFSMSQLDSQEVNSTTYQMRYKRDDGAFESRRVQVNVPFVTRIPIKLQGTTFEVVRVPSSQQIVTQIQMNGRRIANLDQYVDSISIIVKDKNTAYISFLIGIKGQVKVYSLTYFERRVNLSPVSILNVGPSATKMVLFFIEDSLYLTIARSFRGQCAVSDYGSLLYLLQGTSFQLVQRIPVSDSSHVVYYNINGQHYLAFSESSDVSAEGTRQSIQVFKKKDASGCHFVLFQELPFDNLKDLKVLSYGPSSRQQLLVTAVNSTAISVWRQDGQSGFTDSWVMRVDGGESVQPVFVHNQGLFLIVSQGNRCRGTLVFQAKSKGSTLLPIQMINNWSTLT